jgi:hypothetical protein
MLRLHRSSSLQSPTFIALHSSPPSSFIVGCTRHLLLLSWMPVANCNCSYTWLVGLESSFIVSALAHHITFKLP